MIFDYDSIPENLEGMRDELERILREGGCEGAMGAIEGILRDIVSGDTSGKAKPEGEEPDDSWGGPWHGGGYNAIPASGRGVCHPELVVKCYDKDRLDERLREMLYHAGIFCRGHNRKVVLVTTQWDPRTFEKHERAVEVLRDRDGVDVIFVLKGRTGFSRIPA